MPRASEIAVASAGKRFSICSSVRGSGKSRKYTNALGPAEITRIPARSRVSGVSPSTRGKSRSR